MIQYLVALTSMSLYTGSTKESARAHTTMRSILIRYSIYKGGCYSTFHTPVHYVRTALEGDMANAAQAVFNVVGRC